MAIVGRSLQSRQRKRAACHRDRPCENPWTIVGRGRRRGATGLGHGDDRLQLRARPESLGSDHHAHVAQNGAIAEDRSQTADHASLQARHDHGCIRHLRRRGQNERAKLSSKRRRSRPGDGESVNFAPGSKERFPPLHWDRMTPTRPSSALRTPTSEAGTGWKPTFGHSYKKAVEERTPAPESFRQID